jgi:hypothetical protein
VARDHEAHFEAAVESLAGKLGDEFVLELRGPFPPYNFVSVNL